MDRRTFLQTGAVMLPLMTAGKLNSPGTVDVREWGDPINAEVFQAAVDDTTFEVPTNSGPRKNLDLYLPPLEDGDKYRFDEPINMQNRSAIKISCGSKYTLIECSAPGVPAFDMLGSKDILWQNVGVKGKKKSPPSVAFWAGRSGLHRGGSHIAFENCYAEGNFTHAIWYNTSSEFFSLKQCVGFLASATGIATLYQSRLNDLGLSSCFEQPDNFLGAYGLRIVHSALTMSGAHPVCPGSALIISGANYGQIRDSYVASYQAPTIEIKAPATAITVEKVAKEGKADTYLKLTRTGPGNGEKINGLVVTEGGSGNNTTIALDAADIILTGGGISHLMNKKDINIKEIRQFFIRGWADYNAFATLNIEIARYSEVSIGFHNAVNIGLNDETRVGP